MRYFFICALMLFAMAAISQEQLRYGKVTQPELKLTNCSFYEEADAMILGHSGALSFFYSDDNGWGYHLDVIKRVKIFNTKGKAEGDVSIVLYDPKKGGAKEQFGGLKAATYNLVGAKMERTKLTNDQVFTKRLSDYRVKVSFTMPKVQEGSVIEYKYRISSDYITNLHEWHFQEELPTKFSQFSYRIPEYFNYRESQVGAIVELERKDLQTTDHFTYTWETTPGPGQVVQRRKSTMEPKSSQTTMIARNVAPLVEEPFMNNKPNLPSRMEFQLMSWQMPGGRYHPVASSYEIFNKNLLDAANFGGALGKGGFAKEKVAGLEGDALARADAIYIWLRDHFSFNGVYATRSIDAGRKAFNAGKGNIADINLSLVAAWREAGLQAHPVILSTRGHGVPHPVYPNYEDFNYLIAAVEIDEKTYLCDAASTSLPFGTLPIRCLNDKGWMVTAEGGSWINLKERAQGGVSATSEFEFVDDKIVARHQSKYDGYDALIQRSTLLRDGDEKYREKIRSHFPDEEIDGVELQNETTGLKWSVEYSSELEDPEMVYLKPVQTGGLLENMFKRESRMSPIDFPYAFDKRAFIRINIPEGYEVVEMPKPARVSLPEKKGRFAYMISENEGVILISSVFSMAKADFPHMEYPYVKQFFQMAVDKNNELIVLKKL